MAFQLHGLSGMYPVADPLTQSAEVDSPPECLLFGRSPVMLELKRKLECFSAASVPILLQGEVGVGKGALARFVHQRWFAARGHCAHLSCASVDTNWAAFAFCAVLKSSELSTAADSFEPSARPATLFLDEVDELPAKLQRLLAVLMTEQKEAGDRYSQYLPVCIISSSTRDLRSEMKKGRFRRDLLQQLSIGVIDVPPLRERVQDLPEISEYLRQRCCERAGVSDRRFPPDLMERMLLHRWPGNFNELETFIRRFVALGPGHCGLAEKVSLISDGRAQKWMM